MHSIIKRRDPHNSQKVHRFKVHSCGRVEYTQRILREPWELSRPYPLCEYVDSKPESSEQYIEKFLLPLLSGSAYFPVGIGLSEFGRTQVTIEVV